MKSDDKVELLDWCRDVLGPIEVVADHSRSHPDRVSGTWSLRARASCHFVRAHRNRPFWETEVHAYERWASAFGDRAPKLLAVREEEPLAIVISGLPGRAMKEAELTASQQRAAWRDAGRALAALHDSAVGEYFGPCRRDGSPATEPIPDAVRYISADLEGQLDRGIQKGYLSEVEMGVIRAARDLTTVFQGERPVPCHHDYAPDNWLVADDGTWAGVIDFEFARWDVRITDFARHPDWEWMTQSDLLEAFVDGYGQPLTAKREKQLLVARVQYALSAVVWGSDNAYHGFAKEGHQALEHLGGKL